MKLHKLSGLVVAAVAALAVACANQMAPAQKALDGLNNAVTAAEAAGASRYIPDEFGAVQGKVGEPIVVRVNSDATDELHVHSNPEHSFKIEARNGQQFQFTVDVPGTVDIELHQLNRTIASVQVQQ